jgi:hypothetical protein
MLLSEFLAYASNESGPNEMFVRPFSRAGRQLEDFDKSR